MQYQILTFYLDHKLRMYNTRSSMEVQLARFLARMVSIRPDSSSKFSSLADRSIRFRKRRISDGLATFKKKSVVWNKLNFKEN